MHHFRLKQPVKVNIAQSLPLRFRVAPGLLKFLGLELPFVSCLLRLLLHAPLRSLRRLLSKEGNGE